MNQMVFASVNNEPDSAYIFAYSTTKNAGRNGLHFAWSLDRKNWNAIGPELRYLFCDYGRWGTEKRLINPFLFQDQNGLWHCIWSLNEKDDVFAHAASSDLINWHRQSYPVAMPGKNCVAPVVAIDTKSGVYQISWQSNSAGKPEAFYRTTKDFKEYSEAKQIDGSEYVDSREKVAIDGVTETGTIHKVAWSIVAGLLKKQQNELLKSQLNGEGVKEDAQRFAGMKTVDATITVDATKGKKISDMLLGIFFEDINYAADGGLYAELIQNRDFEYALSDKEGKDLNWNNRKAWRLSGTGMQWTIDTISPIHPNNKHYAVLTVNSIGGGLVNEGYDGISVIKGDKYDFSLFARNQVNGGHKLKIELVGKTGEVYAAAVLNVGATKWQKLSAVLTPNETVADARLEIIPQNTGSVALDMISLFPQKTFKGHKNGLRADLSQTIADIHPKFMRFPGGCVSHGDGIGNIYRWKNTIGPLEARKPQRNLWGYHQSAGLGYFEYFQFCEDIGAQPVPVIAAGVPCQNSATGGAGQQGGVPMCDMKQYVQDILDLVEYANGGVNTKWGKLRVEAGHPKPFNLKYIGIGNEDLITDVFEERYTMICKEMKEEHPEITIIGTVGPASEGTDYIEGWEIATKLKLPIVDEHYYQPVGWFINNQDFYDKYDRSKPKVYLGEYASWDNKLYNALTEALYMTSLERNGDVVSMASYAPMLAKEGHTQWNPDLIYFNNMEVKPTVNYYVQKLYGANSGDIYLKSQVDLSDNKSDVRKRVAVSVVKYSKTNDLIIKLVNLLPLSVNVKLDLPDNIAGEGVKTVLSGNPEEKSARPIVENIAVNKDSSYTIPAYSFTVIRCSSK
jgi:Alpha-L-arabinofuranosidase